MYDQLYTTRVNQAFSLAVDKALRKRLPYEVARDIAQDVVIEQADNLFTEGWEALICSRAFEHIKEAVRNYEKECEMRDKLRERSFADKACEQSKTAVRELASEAMTARQWQVCHRIYWHRMTQEEVGIALSITQPTVCILHSRGLLEMRMAMRRLGITKGNWHRWYYEGML